MEVVVLKLAYSLSESMPSWFTSATSNFAARVLSLTASFSEISPSLFASNFLKSASSVLTSLISTAVAAATVVDVASFSASLLSASAVRLTHAINKSHSACSKW